jgi:hypothetical protein
MVDQEFRRMREMEQERKRLIAQHERETRRSNSPNFLTDAVNVDRYLVARRTRVRQKRLQRQSIRDERRVHVAKRRRVRYQRKQERSRKLADVHFRVIHKLFSSKKK